MSHTEELKDLDGNPALTWGDLELYLNGRRADATALSTDGSGRNFEEGEDGTNVYKFDADDADDRVSNIVWDVLPQYGINPTGWDDPNIWLYVNAIVRLNPGIDINNPNRDTPLILPDMSWTPESERASGQLDQQVLDDYLNWFGKPLV